MLCNSVTFKFWATLELFRRHGNHKPKRFDFCIEYKLIYRTLTFHYQWLKIFSLLEETDIGSSIAFLKSLSIFAESLFDRAVDVRQMSKGQGF